MTAHDEKLRAAFAARPARAATGDCPTPEALLAAYTGEAEAERRAAVIAHLAACPACAEDWRLARALLPDEAGVAAREARPARVLRGPWPRQAWLAAAALLVLSLAGLFVSRLLTPPPPGWRSGDTPEIRALLADDALVSRAECRLRWSFAVPGARFALRVSDESLQPLASARDLGEAEFLVPEPALRGVAAGARILWQVDARLPDGGSVTSKTFRARLR